MAAATLMKNGWVVIPAGIRERYGLTAGTQVEFVDDGGTLRLVVRRRTVRSDPEQGYGMVKVPPRGRPRRLADFDAAKPSRPA
jgi:AbrB family looped-hinge helix DNA binding protein